MGNGMIYVSVSLSLVGYFLAAVLVVFLESTCSSLGRAAHYQVMLLQDPYVY